MTASPSSQPLESESTADWLVSLPPDEQAAWWAENAPTPLEAAAIEHSWLFWARPKQLPPAGTWRTWLVLAGRGFGKTRVGAEWIVDEVRNNGARRLALVAATAADVRDVMLQGESGLLTISPPDFRPEYEPSKRRLTWPNGATATLFSAEKPARLRGPQYDRVWADELAAWKYPETWDQITFGLRLVDALGGQPRACVTTTPRPIPVVQALLKNPSTRVTRGSTYENRGNLADEFLAEVLKKYEGTRLGRQELHAELLLDVPGALWTRALLDGVYTLVVPNLRRIVVAIDPAVSSGEDSDETGIVVAGTDGERGYVLEDLSGKHTPAEWARIALSAYKRWSAERIVAEVNNGGALVEANLRSFRDDAKGLDGKLVPFKAVHASRGKAIRAEPVSALYEQRRVSHIGSFPQLEDQLCTWSPDADASSPDRLDALVWAFTELMLGGAPAAAPSSLDKYRNKMPGLRR